MPEDAASQKSTFMHRIGRITDLLASNHLVDSGFCNPTIREILLPYRDTDVHKKSPTARNHAAWHSGHCHRSLDRRANQATKWRQTPSRTSTRCALINTARRNASRLPESVFRQFEFRPCCNSKSCPAHLHAGRLDCKFVERVGRGKRIWTSAPCIRVKRLTNRP